MSAISTVIALHKLKDEDIAWKLLRAKQAPLIIAVLDAHFTESTTRIPVPEFVNLVDIDLENIASRTSIEITNSAEAYCKKWRDAGFLIRRPVAQSRQETYELSAGATLAIDYTKRMMQPHRTATQSRLSIIIDQINNLAIATDTNEDRRRQALLEERARIDNQLQAIDSGTYATLTSTEASERIKDIVTLAREIPADFIHVRNDFEQINRSLYETIINFGEGHADILNDIFDGVDEISQSPSGQSFKGFYALLRNADLTETLQDDIDTILDQDFSQQLTVDERRFLRRLVRTFVDQSQDVNSVMTSFAQGLRRFVQSQNYQQERQLKIQLDQALGQAHRIVEHYSLSTKLNQQLNLTSVRIAPISRYKLKNPLENQAAPIAETTQHTAQVFSLEELKAIARETEIDFTELTKNINECLASALLKAAQAGNSEDSTQPFVAVTVADVLESFPATQGASSIIGLISLALSQGVELSGEELITWQTTNNGVHCARIPKLAFNGKVVL